MSKGSLPASMDLLLDTMCNTFGGVVFIAISLSLAFFVSNTKVSEKSDEEKVRQELQQTRQESAALKTRQEELVRRLSDLKKISTRKRTVKMFLPEQVAALEQDCRDLARESALQKKSLAEHQAGTNKVEKENGKLSAETRWSCEKAAAENQKLLNERQELVALQEELNEKLKRTPKKKFHFAHEEETRKSPYVIVIDHNRLCRLGGDYHHSSPDVEVSRRGNMLFLTLKNGTPLSAISETKTIRQHLQDFNPSTSFLWIIVHPNSLNAFVEFRRQLRKASYSVHWYVCSTFVLSLGENPGYSASF